MLALLGVVAAPITSGDTAFRSARLIVADIFHYDQKPIVKRLVVCVPLFVIGFGITLLNFGVVWRYFAWANQTLAVATLWTIYVWLVQSRKNYWVALIPALVMTFIVSYFVFMAPQFLGISNRLISVSLGLLVTIVIYAAVYLRATRSVKTEIEKA